MHGWSKSLKRRNTKKLFIFVKMKFGKKIHRFLKIWVCTIQRCANFKITMKSIAMINVFEKFCIRICLWLGNTIVSFAFRPSTFYGIRVRATVTRTRKKRWKTRRCWRVTTRFIWSNAFPQNSGHNYRLPFVEKQKVWSWPNKSSHWFMQRISKFRANDKLHAKRLKSFCCKNVSKFSSSQLYIFFALSNGSASFFASWKTRRRRIRGTKYQALRNSSAREYRFRNEK